MQDCFPEAAVRHYLDATMLYNAGRYDNAMCHYAFSAECAIKAFREQFGQVYPGIHSQPTHQIEPILESMTEYHELLGVLVPQLSIFIGIGTPPPILFQEHPQRRYGNDVNYIESDLAECKVFTAELARQVVSAAIDGKLQYNSERGAL